MVNIVYKIEILWMFLLCISLNFTSCLPQDAIYLLMKETMKQIQFNLVLFNLWTRQKENRRDFPVLENTETSVSEKK